MELTEALSLGYYDYSIYRQKGITMQKTVLVTGASRGIGRAIALAFAAAPFPYQIVINSHNSSGDLDALQREITETYGKPCLALTGDVGDCSATEKIFADIRKYFGTVDILINNAGISHVGLLGDMKPEEWNRVLSTNLSSAFYTSRLAIPDMVRQQWGKIINISSVWGTVGASCEVAYSASKGGLNTFTKALAKELAPSNIQVNAIACGVIDTQMNACFSADELDDLRDEIPSGRFGTPKEVAALALSLAESHSYLTGQIITLDGGWI